MNEKTNTHTHNTVSSCVDDDNEILFDVLEDLSGIDSQISELYSKMKKTNKYNKLKKPIKSPNKLNNNKIDEFYENDPCCYDNFIGDRTIFPEHPLPLFRLSFKSHTSRAKKYTRLDHFTNIMSELCGTKVDMNIPYKIIKNIDHELSKNNLKNPSIEQVAFIMKKMGRNHLKWLCDIVYIRNTIFNKQPIDLKTKIFIINKHKSTIDNVYEKSQQKINDNCSICLEPLNLTYDVLECDHCFHKKCINDWIEIKMECPMCRQIINCGGHKKVKQFIDINKYNNRSIDALLTDMFKLIENEFNKLKKSEHQLIFPQCKFIIGKLLEYILTMCYFNIDPYSLQVITNFYNDHNWRLKSITKNNYYDKLFQRITDIISTNDSCNMN
jgi:hypothetical protein